MVLGKVTDGAPRFRYPGVTSENQRVAPGWVDRREQRLDKGGLSRTIRPQQPKNRAARNLKRNPINRPNSTPGPARAVDFGQVAGLDGVLGLHSSLGYAGNRKFVPISGPIAEGFHLVTKFSR